MSKDQRLLVILGVFIAMVALVLLMAAQLFENDDDLEMCMLHQLQEHRVNTYDADRDAAAADGRVFNVPRAEPQIDSRFQEACQRISP